MSSGIEEDDTIQREKKKNREEEEKKKKQVADETKTQPKAKPKRNPGMVFWSISFRRNLHLSGTILVKRVCRGSRSVPQFEFFHHGILQNF